MARPNDVLQAVLLHNFSNEEGEHVPTRYEVGSWVTLTPDWQARRGGRRRSSRVAVENWKAQIVNFTSAKAAVGDAFVVQCVLVRHAYESRQLGDLDPDVMQPRRHCNYLFPSLSEDEVEPESITGVIVVMHAEVGEAIHLGRSHRELLNEGIYFYSHHYYPAEAPATHGKLVPIPLPPFSDPSWPLPDMASSEAFRAKLFYDFRKSMKASTGSPNTHIKWFMPIGVFVDLVAVADNIHRTPTLFVIRELTDATFASLMDDGWDAKIVDGEDMIKCTVLQNSVIFRYHVGRQTLYTNFQFNRSRFVAGKWEDMDQGESCELVEVRCIMENFIDTVFVVGKQWPLSTIRQELRIALDESAPEEYSLSIAMDGVADLKVNRRYEKKILASTVVSPRFVRVVADD